MALSLSKPHTWAVILHDISGENVRLFCVFVVVAGNALTEQGLQVKTSLLLSQSNSVLIHLYNK